MNAQAQDTEATVPPINVFIYVVDPTIEGQLKRFGVVQVPASSSNPEQDGWLGYLRRNGTPPVGEYFVLRQGHHYKVNTSQTLTVADLGTTT